MKTSRFIIVFLFTALCQFSSATSPLRIWFNQPAVIWEETLPIGNGRIGAMPDGGIFNERIILNDITLWSGSVQDADNPDAAKYLPEIRRLLFEGKNDEAQNLVYKTFVCKGEGSGQGNGANVPYGSFQMLANLNIRSTPSGKDTTYTDYHRELSLNDAVVSCRYTLDGVKYTREYFSSFNDDVIVIRLSADKKKKLNLNFSMDRPERALSQITNDAIIFYGQLNDGTNGNKGMRFRTVLQIKQTGGKLVAEGNELALKNADEAILIIATGTDFKNPDFEKDIEKNLQTAKNKSYNQLKADHIQKYKALFDRVELNISGANRDDLPTNKRLIEYAGNPVDNGLAALYFQFGRYLLISSSRPGILPPNLQGLWANTIQTPWNGDYHMNINIQMNLWPAEVTNLAELHEPLIDLTQSMVKPGEKTAQAFYNAQGWVAHMMTNVWGYTAPGEHPSWGATNTGGGWMCEHLWEHYLFQPDEQYLKKIYPTLKGASLFFLSMLIKDPANGWLVTAPSTSPENAFLMPGTKKAINICMGPTMDNQIIRELFGNTISAAQLLKTDDDLIRKLQEASAKLPPMQIGKHGQLMEWLEDYDEAEPHHRHVSHLYGLHPSNQITPSKTPDLAQAAKVTLDRRGDGGTGWSRAWKINFWARLGDGNRAWTLLNQLLTPTKTSEMEMSNKGGTYPNLFCAHPPFQIDGNFGGCAGIAEMLVQSHDEYVDILPALPDQWATGSFKGLRIRGGATVDLQWKDKQAENMSIQATNDNIFRIKMPKDKTISRVTINAITQKASAQNGILELKLKKGDQVQIVW